ncbi:hypothetical protein HNQ94_003470 [Salirhabdus euzebyi]|uniref:Uncharacterized protein n=1 Tax=Salirhabdus euzebyi TaxID=394506 RepID=A0A841Q9A5_9BACI|nr:DUF5325 family protein [Salirhabdus euzebyi]MBB6454976.1 hypothetical protein [Salirhabdus euzebyi]
MRNNVLMVIIAIFVILSFSMVGVALAYRNYLIAGLLFLLGFIIMGFGLRLKRKRQS